MKHLLFVFVALVVVASALTGCNTVRGAGEDVEAAGDAVERATH